MLELICWKWRGDEGYRSKFDACHVNALYEMVEKNLTLPHRFSCITDDAAGIRPEIRIIPLWHDFEDLKNPGKKLGPSCYRRLKAFSAEAKEIIGERIFSLDLDTVIVGNIDEVVNRSEDFVCYGGTAKNTAYNGGMFLLRAGSRAQVWTSFDPITSPKITRAKQITGSDQGWISYVLKGLDPIWTEADGVYSFQKHFAKTGRTELPENAKIINFNGNVDPWTPGLDRYPWIKAYPIQNRAGVLDFKLKPDHAPEPERKVPDKLTCITFLWGKEPYNYHYVNKLFNMIDRHLTYPHHRVCFTNIPHGIRADVEIKLLHNEWMKGNLKKAIQFDPENGLEGRILSFDLDNVILQNIDTYAEYSGPFAVCQSINKARKGKPGGNLISFEAGFGAEIWQKLTGNYKHFEVKTQGSERFLLDATVKSFHFWPRDEIVSYRHEILKNKVKDLSKVKMVTCHGRPNPHEIDHPLVIENWK